MACLKKLSVSGIRSFDPESREVITFYPLTLILGANGAGKTTLIECLRYSATNEFPPFTNKGKTWIHDLHFAKSHTNRGQVKLSFKDIHGEDCVVTRSLELTAKRDRSGKVVPQMRTLDAIIKRGEETVVSTKCVQIDSVMLDLLGVSKAVLSDVIFCHQEDSNWPLSESKVLKEKFDQLFGSIGYVKALKKIKDERAEYAKLQAHCDGELKLFQEHKVQFETFFNDLAKQKADLSSCKERMNTLVSELGPIKKELESLAVKEKAMVEVEKAISGLQAQLDEQQKSIEYLKKNIKDIFNGTKEDLLEKIANFSDDLRKKEVNLKKAEKDIDEFEDNLKQLNSKLNRISSTKIKLEAKQSKFSGDKKKFQNLIDRLSNETFAGFEEASHLDIENDTESTLAKVQNLVDLQRCQVESELKKTIEQYDMKIKEVDDKLDDLKSKKSKMEQTIKINNESIQAKNSEAKRITAQLKEISQSSSKFKQYAKDIEVKKEELAQIEKDSDLDEIQTRINELYETILKSKAKLDELNKEKDKLQEQNEARAVLQVYLKNQEREQDNLSTIYAENVQLLTDLNIDEQDYDKSFADELKARIRQVERKFKTKEAEKESMLNDRRKLENQLDRIKIKFEDCKKEIKDKESKIKSVCGSTSFEKVLESTETELKSLRNKSANSSGAQTLLTEYSVIIEKDGNCPVCDTDVSSNKSKVKQSLSEKIRKLPQEAKKVDEMLAKKEEFYGQLLRLKADYDTVKNSKDLLPKLKQDVADAQKKVDGITEKIEKVEKELKKEKSELDRLRAVESQATSYDNSARALQEIERKIRKCKEELGSEENDEMRSIDDIREEIEDLTNDLRQKENELKELQDTKDATTTKIGSLKQIILDLESKKLELEKGQQRQVSLTEKCSELQQQIAQLTKDVKNFESEIKFFEPKLIEAESTKKKLIKEKETERAKRESLLSKLNRYQDDFIAVGEDIQSYLMDDTDSEIQDLKEEFDQCKRDIEELNGKKIELSKICDCHRKDIIEAESKERNLNDNLQLMERNEKAKQYKEKLEKEILKRGAADSVALLKKKTQLEKQFLEKSNQLNQIKGKQEPIVNRIRELEDYLSTDKYAKAKENYSRKLIDSVEIEAICDDLNKLYRALDHSVMVFHKKKMDEINRYLYKLWKQAYRGNDIDYIKIESDTDTERSASDKRRSFNYRVVMIRDRAEMDMRGRCSAGQKVIASLVIRLALAEIFSVNCGILALDEPTTNLDKDNIQAFADSVTNIVRLHKNQRFQLVIITHDDQFLKCLRESEVEFYYEVSKDDKGYSKIKQLSIREREM